MSIVDVRVSAGGHNWNSLKKSVDKYLITRGFSKVRIGHYKRASISVSQAATVAHEIYAMEGAYSGAQIKRLAITSGSKIIVSLSKEA